VPKSVIFLLQVGFTRDFVPDCLYKLCFWQFKFDTTFLPDCTKFFCVFLCYSIGNLMRIPKMCLKLSFFDSKWVLQAILSLTVLCNCVLGSSNFDSTFLSDCTKFVCVFLCYWIGNLMRIPKNVLKSVIFSLQVGFTCDFVPDCLYKFCFWQFKVWHHFSPWLYWIF